MGIWISEPYQDFSETEWLIGRDSDSGTKALTEAEFISYLTTQTRINFNKISDGNYQSTNIREIPESTSYTNYLPTSSPVGNFDLISTSTVITTDEDEDYRYKYYNCSLTYKHKYSLGRMAHKRMAANQARIIYEKMSRYWETEEEESWSDGYVGSETIIVIFRIVQKEEIEHDEPIPVTPTSFGAFPNGLGADYCYLACKTDSSYVSTLDINFLNEIANDYAQTIDSTLPELTYYGQDANGFYVIVQKDTVDNSTELNADWNNLYGTILNLQNDIIRCEINGIIKDCYKIYIAGKCQLLEFDGQKFVEDQGGSTEVPEYNLPNGYYIIIGDSLRLFLLTDIDSVEYPYNGSDTTIRFNQYSSIGNGITSVQSRVNYYPNAIYVYSGHSTDYVSSISASSVIFSEVSNLRKVTISDSITNVGHLGGQANPDNGFYFPKYIEHIGPLTITYTAGTSVYVPSTYLKTISDNAFYNGTSINPNMRLYLCENPQEAEELFNIGYFEPSAELISIGNQALYGLSLNCVDLTNCLYLEYVGKEALATSSACKTFYFLGSQLSQRTDVSNQNLIYLPDETISYVDSSLPYSIPTQNSASYDNDTAHRTLGVYLSGYNISLSN